MAFTRAELREALGEAYTDDIAKKVIELHRSVVDPIKDDLDAAKRDVTKYKADAEKLPGVQKELDDFKKEDWKTKYDNEKKAHDDYKAQVARDAETAKVKAAYKKLLTEEKISEKTLESILNATDYSGMKLKEDGSLDKIEDLKKDIDAKWGGFKVTQRQRGEKVDNPPANNGGGSDSSIREMTAKWHAQRFGQIPAQDK
ncbi:MAG: hypothetical protein IKQ01_06495 [Bacteroidales bacterium]|nr:hypothetical protein [Bacteroidales bacterium]